MRISDWSSDVCSSDLIDDQRLLQDGADLLTRVQRAVGILKHDLHRLTQLALRLALGLGHVDAVEHQGAGRRPFDQRHHAGERGLAAAGLADYRQRLAGGTREAGAVRSEEHTSELQSLMRSSYAVFCLKKKNN